MTVRDVAERVLWTFVQAFLGAFVVVSFTDVDPLEGAAIAGLTAVFSLIKNVAARRLKELPEV